MQVETDWYKPICPRCPYFSNIEGGLRLADVQDDGINGEQKTQPLIKCERPFDIGCLAESPLIERSEIIRRMEGLAQLNKMADRNINYQEMVKRTKMSIPGKFKRGKIRRKS